MTTFSHYGSSTHKQVYIYGSLDRAPTTIPRTFGLAWGVGGYLVSYALRKLGAEAYGRMTRRVNAELTTTFASHYTRTISLPEVLDLGAIAVYNKRATGEKFLINPNK